MSSGGSSQQHPQDWAWAQLRSSQRVSTATQAFQAEDNIYSSFSEFCLKGTPLKHIVRDEKKKKIHFCSLSWRFILCTHSCAHLVHCAWAFLFLLACCSMRHTAEKIQVLPILAFVPWANWNYCRARTHSLSQKISSPSVLFQSYLFLSAHTIQSLNC